MKFVKLYKGYKKNNNTDQQGPNSMPGTLIDSLNVDLTSVDEKQLCTIEQNAS